MKDFLVKIVKFKEVFDKKLEEFLLKKQKEAKLVSPEYYELTKYLSEYILAGGKRIRPFLAYMGYKVSGGKNNSKIMRLGMALEIFHSYALIHDDIIDFSNLRRNKPTFHIRLQEWHKNKKWRGDSKDFGLGLAVLAGDMLCTWSNELVFNLNSRKVYKLFQEMKNEIMIGQAEDIFLSEVQNITDKDRIVSVMMRKTSDYTAQKPLMLGATLAGAKQRYQDLYKNISMPLGLAFQLKDDVLGMFGKRKEIGKPTDSDIKEGKITLLIYYALKSGKISRDYMLDSLGNKKITRKQINDFKLRVKNSGALSRVDKEIDRYIKKAKSVVKLI
jgi:geranylgeranyl diphosphate synthase type I